jgi:hypothetical protein
MFAVTIRGDDGLEAVRSPGPAGMPSAGGLSVPLLIVAFVGYVMALPVLVWHRHDLRSFRGPLWSGYGRRSSRLNGALVCYAAAGWPEVLMALGWRSSVTRKALLIERDNFRSARELRGSGANGAP